MRKLFWAALPLVLIPMLAVGAGAENMKENYPKATFAGGCFWGMEKEFAAIDGVVSTRVGYTGGKGKNPTYQIVCAGGTGHAEAVEITYDPAKVSYEDLLAFFFMRHDPTTRDRQGNDVGSQYRSAIFTHSYEQQRAAEKTKSLLEQAHVFHQPIVTQISAAFDFYPAEAYHQKYLEKNPKGYCHINLQSSRVLEVLKAAGSSRSQEGQTTAVKQAPPAVKIKIFNAQTDRVEEVEPVIKTDAEWSKILTPEQFQVTRKKGTESPFSGQCSIPKSGKGYYQCVGCGTALFRVEHKFESGTGWPSFWDPVSQLNLTVEMDADFGTRREEVVCARCGAHLGHVFDDGPPPSGKRYCINSVAIKLAE